MGLSGRGRDVHYGASCPDGLERVPVGSKELVCWLSGGVAGEDLVVAEGVSCSVVSDVHGGRCLQEGGGEGVCGLGGGFVPGVEGSKVSEEIALCMLLPGGGVQSF